MPSATADPAATATAAAPADSDPTAPAKDPNPNADPGAEDSGATAQAAGTHHTAQDIGLASEGATPDLGAADQGTDTRLGLERVGARSEDTEASAREPSARDHPSQDDTDDSPGDDSNASDPGQDGSTDAPEPPDPATGRAMARDQPVASAGRAGPPGRARTRAAFFQRPAIGRQVTRRNRPKCSPRGPRVLGRAGTGHQEYQCVDVGPSADPVGSPQPATAAIAMMDPKYALSPLFQWTARALTIPDKNQWLERHFPDREPDPQRPSPNFPNWPESPADTPVWAPSMPYPPTVRPPEPTPGGERPKTSLRPDSFWRNHR